MKTLTFSKQIKAPRDKVWKILWNDSTYRKWTSVFSEGSYAEGDWKEGGKIKFLGPEGSGIDSIIEKMSEPEVMTFRHQAEIKNNVVQPPGEWKDSRESYFLAQENGNTELTVTLDATEDFAKYFQDTFPKALDKVKELSEN